MQVALGLLWRRRGVVPGGVVGHSVGEVAAAVLAGVVSVTDGARVIAAVADGGQLATLEVHGYPLERRAGRVVELPLASWRRW
ncbi:acyltransferase domain-containing protein [Kribbella qitaiheensis]|uniref:acyltransferase domain-containing protein n=1 Tax=Kribbella qitaiheensis TaxID=1544730 RepID=UPI001624F51B|nr:acyltransferase domain-containing protein [Kribbella qitaiheensis]